MPTNPCATGWTASIFSPTTIVVDGNTFPQTAQGIQAAVDSITDASATKPYTILLYPGIYDMNWANTSVTLDLTGTTTPFSAGTGGKDYIGLAGLDRDKTVLKRTTAAGLLTAAIQGCPHTYIRNLTIDSGVTRCIHWDTSGDLFCDAISFVSTGANSAGVSSGIVSTASASSRHRITNCHFQGTQYSCHSNTDGAGALANYIWITGCTFSQTGTVIGLSLTSAGANSVYHISISGNVQPYFNVDHGFGAIDLNMPTNATASTKVFLYTDGSLRIADSTLGAIANNTYYHNMSIYPQNFYGYQVTGTAPIGLSGDVLIYDYATSLLRASTATGQSFPAICVNQSDNTGTTAWFPRLGTGPRAACFMATAGAVAVGDQIVAAAANKQGYVNNSTGLNIQQILGWAESTKSAAATGLVTVRRNTSFCW